MAKQGDQKQKELSAAASYAISIGDVKPTKKDGLLRVEATIPCNVVLFAEVSKGRCTNVRLQGAQAMKGGRGNRQYIDFRQVQNALGQDVRLSSGVFINDEAIADVQRAIESKLEDHDA